MIDALKTKQLIEALHLAQEHIAHDKALPPKLSIPKKEIHASLARLKKIAARKAISREALAKEINALESVLNGVLGLDTALMKREEHAERKVLRLHEQISQLKRMFALAQQGTFKKKLDRVHFLLSESMAQKEAAENAHAPAAEEATDEELAVRVRQLSEQLQQIKAAKIVDPRKIALVQQEMLDVKEMMGSRKKATAAEEPKKEQKETESVEKEEQHDEAEESETEGPKEQPQVPMPPLPPIPPPPPF